MTASRVNHLAFRGAEVDWQIWIEDGDKPLSRKYVITSKLVTASPEFTVSFSRFNLSPRLTDKMFIFVPPKDAKKVDFIRPAGVGTSSR